MAKRTPAAAKTLAILDLLAASPDGAYTLSQICSRSDLGLSTAHSILNTMVDSGYLVRDPELKTYSLGPAVVAVGHAALDRHRVVDVARDEMRQVADELGREAITALCFGDELVITGRAGRPPAFRPLVTVGQRVPLLAPAGVL